MIKPLLRSLSRAVHIPRVVAAWRGRAQRRELYHALVACSVTVAGLRRPEGPQAVRRTRGAV